MFNLKKEYLLTESVSKGYRRHLEGCKNEDCLQINKNKKRSFDCIETPYLVAGVGNQPSFCTPKQRKIKVTKCY